MDIRKLPIGVAMALGQHLIARCHIVALFFWIVYYVSSSAIVFQEIAFWICWENRKTLEHNILSGRSKKLAFPMLAVIVLITIGCQADRELTKSQREDVIASAFLSENGERKRNHISASETHHIFNEQRGKQSRDKKKFRSR